MSRFRFELATPDDDADLRRVLAETPMEGRIAVTFRREPSWFAAARLEGHFQQVVACRDTGTGRIVGFGCRCIRRLFVNGEPRDIGYLGGLRLLAEYRNQGLVARGYAFFRRLHADARAPFYLTTIAEGNTPALSVLTSARAGLPNYHAAGTYLTLAIPFAKSVCTSTPGGISIRPATLEDTPAIVAFLQEVGPSRQFFPVYQEADFFTNDGALRDLSPADLLLAFDGRRLVGTLGAWDQHALKQTVVVGYRGALRWLRPAVNGWFGLTGRPGLPAPGSPFRFRTAALPVVRENCVPVFEALLGALRARFTSGPCTHLLLGLHETDPLLAAVRKYALASYAAQLFVVSWESHETVGVPALAGAASDRPLYLELGSL